MPERRTDLVKRSVSGKMKNRKAGREGIMQVEALAYGLYFEVVDTREPSVPMHDRTVPVARYLLGHGLRLFIRPWMKPFQSDLGMLAWFAEHMPEVPNAIIKVSPSAQGATADEMAVSIRVRDLFPILWKASEYDKMMKEKG